MSESNEAQNHENVATGVAVSTPVKPARVKAINKYTSRAHEIQLAKRAKHHRKIRRHTKG